MFDENRPKIKLQKDQTQKVLEIIVLICVIFCFVYPSIYYSTLPEQVPMHFNYKGEVNSYGGKDSLFVLAIIGALTSFALFKLNQYPHIFNYPIKITKENAEKQYKESVKMITYMNVLIAILFVITSYQIVNIALNNGNQFGIWSEYLIYTIVATLTFGPLIFVLLKVFRRN